MKDKLGNHIQQVRGVSYKPNDLSETLSDGYITLLRANNISEGKINFDSVQFVSSSKVSSEQILKTNDILVCSSSGSLSLVGKSALYKKTGEHTFGAFCKVVRATGKLLPQYIAFYMCSQAYRRHIENIANGANINNLRNEHLDDILLPIPSETKQNAIITKLEKVESVISHRRAQLAKLDELVKCRFVELFGDCRSNPKQWATKKLEEIAIVGSSKRVFVEELIDDGIPFYRGTEVGALAEGQQITPELFISESHYQALCEASGKPVKGDLLMPSICPDGRIWIVDSDSPFYFKDGRVLWVHDIHEQYNPVFLQYTLKDRIITDYASIASGTTFAELKIFTLKSCKIFDVPLSLQNIFAAFIQRIDKLRFVIQQSLDETQKLFDSLMQEYFD